MKSKTFTLPPICTTGTSNTFSIGNLSSRARFGIVLALTLAVCAGCGATATSRSSESTDRTSNTNNSSNSDNINTTTNPDVLYAALDLDDLPGNRGSDSIGPFQLPALPETTQSVTISTTGFQAGIDITAACQTPGTEVTVPDAAGRIGNLDIGYSSDCDITFGYGVVIDLVYVGHLPGPQVAPSRRIRVRGGRIGGIIVDPGTTDIIFDSVIVDNDVNGAANRRSIGVYLRANNVASVERLAFVNSVIRMLPTVNGTTTSGAAYMGDRTRDVLFANNNIVTAGNNNSWGFRLSGAHNFIVMDNVIRVSHHKLIRMNDHEVDYVFVKGGIWIREDSQSSGGPAINDSFQQLGDDGTDNIYIHDTEVYLLSPVPVGFGSTYGPGQNGNYWEAHNITWHALNDTIISDNDLTTFENTCTNSGVNCDYGIGTHTYIYNPGLTFPANPWNTLPALPEDNPDLLPPAP